MRVMDELELILRSSEDPNVVAALEARIAFLGHGDRAWLEYAVQTLEEGNFLGRPDRVERPPLYNGEEK